MDVVVLLAAICLSVNASRGMRMMQLSRDIDYQYKTAFVQAHKLPETIARAVRTGEVLEGDVEIDGAYFEPPRVYRRFSGTMIRLLFRQRSSLHRRPPLLLAA